MQELAPKLKLLVSKLLRHLRKASGSYLVPFPNYWAWTKNTPQKNSVFWSNSCKIKVMITSLVETLELPNFGHMTTFTIWFESSDKILLITSWTEIMPSKPLFQNGFILRTPGVVNFADSINIAIMFIKKPLKT